MQYVVFGASGYIGSYIYQQLSKDGFNVVGTCHKTLKYDKMVSYDIQKNSIDNVMSEIYDVDRTAIICIAQSGIDWCYKNYSQAYDINVIKTQKLICELSQNGFQIIYFSTDNVFDGISGNYTEESQTHAINKYGMMKEEMEHFLLANEPKVCIFRLPKVVSISKEKQNVFTEWTNQIIEGSTRCIKGNYLSFVYIDDVYRSCLLAAEKKLHGLYNITGDEIYSRLEIVRKFYDMADITQIDVQEYDLDKFSFIDKRPLNIGMSNLKFKKETGYQFKGMDSLISMYISNMNIH